MVNVLSRGSFSGHRTQNSLSVGKVWKDVTGEGYEVCLVVPHSSGGPPKPFLCGNVVFLHK